MLNLFKRNKINILIIFILLILPYIFFKDVLKVDSIIFGQEQSDLILYTLPIRQLMIDLIKNFEFPFWNRYILAGFPLLANPQSFVFYPITFILDLQEN